MRILKLSCMAFAIGMWVISSGIDFCYSQSASEETALSTPLFESQMSAEMQKIREKRNKAVVSYDNLKRKMKDTKKATYLQEVNQKIDKHYALAKTLEEKGDYVNATKCYRKIFKLVKDRRLRSFIAKENKKLKLRAAKEKILAREMIDQTRRALAKKKEAVLERKAKETPKKERRLSEEALKKLEERLAMLETEFYVKVAESVPPSTASVEILFPPKDVEDKIEATEQVTEQVTGQVNEQAPETKEVPQTDEIMEKKIDEAEYLIENADSYYEKLNYKKAYQIYKEALTKVEKISIPKK
ncbi:MAG: hypothetical protein ISS92_05210 [Candidatus Omnitrophica bacterium]|nr:hypothetical protein [Candidatus Omnitrophota bacterium]